MRLKSNEKRMVLAALAVAGALAAQAVDWEFTGDVSREAASASEPVAISGEFDSRMPPDIWLTGFRFTSFPPIGFLLFLH